ncbi:MAG: sulfite exporter TauE/SafE family protein [Pseudomonadota bacterium]
MLSSIDWPNLAMVAASLGIAGAIAGVLAGLFGIGGGAVLVPVLVEFLRLQGVSPDVLTHIAIGTSLAIIIPTSIHSFRSHLARGAPDTELLRRWAVWVPLGVIIASLVVADISGDMLKVIFGVVIVLVAIKMLANRKDWSISSDLPRPAATNAVGFGIGLISALMGIGGGNLNNMFMTSFGRPIHQAVATSAGLGMLIAIPGVLGYIYAGWGNPALPPLSLGYVSLIAVALITPTSLLFAPIGVRLAHGLSKRQMEVAFGVFLLAVAGRMFWTAL